ncbi:MAG: NfeD family protein [Promethearchaeia archaeon]
MEILRTISVFILLIGFAFLMAELMTEEVEFFAPVTSITLIIGLILFFLSDPKEWLEISSDFYPYFVLIIIIIGTVPIIISIVILFKIRAIKDKPHELLDFIGKEVAVIKAINSTKKGYVRFRGEKWHAVSSNALQEGEKAIIDDVNLNGLTLKVKKSPSESETSESGTRKQKSEKGQIETKRCPYCGNQIDKSSKICPACGSELK